MTQLHEPAPASHTRPSVAWAGWVGFAAVILAMIGTLDVLQGIIALFDEGYFVVAGTEQLFLLSFTAWGVVMILWGLFVLSAAYGLANGRGWARWLALVAVFSNVVLQIGFLSAFPIGSAIMIALDVIVIYALTARWDEARAAM
jgi:hypothetical protein